MKIFISVGRKNRGGEAGLGDADAQLFLQFADQAGLGRLPRLDLSARKLP